MRDEQAAAIVECARRFEATGIEYWLFGGWAVDYHAGRVTRSHDDGDFVIWVRDQAAVIEVLSASGLNLCDHRHSIEFEITLTDRASDGAIVTPGFEEWPSDAGTFGTDVRCRSALGGSCEAQPVERLLDRVAGDGVGQRRLVNQYHASTAARPRFLDWHDVAREVKDSQQVEHRERSNIRYSQGLCE